ncbi:TonB-dependent receptor [Steroidobacter sp.]|uniref:TonB-dependent receptor n=1 Tax=Steroidobacter sp. TaxID=1978227 RepID=UPI001A50E6B3|nr:TonB-dependent receptor [Steroidobacter sp.]MBL8271140.1 TonB-dependent receptor [Steroidobacter sp.]
MTRSIWVRAAVAAMLCTAAHAEPVLPEATALTEIVLDIKAQPVRQALQAFGEQTGLQVLFRSEGVSLDGVTSLGVSGKLSTREALDRLLRQTGLQYEFINQRTVRISAIAATSSRAPNLTPNLTSSSLTQAEPANISLAQAVPNDAASTDAAQAAAEGPVRGIPEVMVFGKKSLNTDIERTEDDPQPYVVFDRTSIERAGAANLNDFLMTRLPMNAAMTTSPGVQNAGNRSQIALRGLMGQTLILIDGRRAAPTSAGFSAGQTDINGIPMNAIERIEILPTTASAVYGGSATGGVINIIMRRDYAGTEAAVTYDNSFDSDSAVKRYEVSSGFSLFEGKTSVLLNGSYIERNSLAFNERDLVQRGRARIVANNPDYLGFMLPQANGTNLLSVGGDLVLDDGTPLNSYFTSAPPGYGGFASDGGAALRANAGRYNLGLASISDPGFQGANAAMTGGGPPVKYFGGSVRHEFSDRVKGFFEISHSENNARVGGRGMADYLTNVAPDAPSNPFQQPLIVPWSSNQVGGYQEYSSEYDRYGAGVILQLPGGWTSSIDYTLSKSKYAYRDNKPYFGSAFDAAVADGTIDVLRGFDAQGVNLSQYIESDFTILQTPLEVTTDNPALRLSGPIGSLPAGRPQLSLLLERQDTDFGSSSVIQKPSAVVFLYPERSQKVDSAYLELRVPLLSSLTDVRWAQELELQLAGRWDKYQSVNANRVIRAESATSAAPFNFVRNESEEFSPLIALRFRPIDDIAFRASWGTGFLPPDISQLGAPNLTPAANISFARDPRRGGTAPSAPIRDTWGSSPDLKPESSTTWSAGLIFTPTWFEGLRLSIDYTQIEKEDNITALTIQQILDNEAYFPGRVTRGASLPGDPAGWAGPIIAIDRSNINAASTNLEAYDVQLDYTLPTASKGTFEFFAIATWQTQLDVQTVASAPVVDSLGWGSSLNTPLDLKGNLGVSWSLHSWTLGWTTRYSSSYYVANPASASSSAIFLAQGDGGRVPAQTYHDVVATYQFGVSHSGRFGSLLDGLKVQAGVRNVFNTKPPVDISASSLYYYSGLGDPRLATYYLTLRKDFGGL